MSRQDRFNIKRKQKQHSAVVKRIGVLIANEAVNLSKSNFDVQGFQDTGTEKWKEVKRRTPGTKAYRSASKGKGSGQTSPILVRTGKLKRSIRYRLIQNISGDVDITIFADIAYAKYHNEGTRTIPRRRFMGPSAELRKRVSNIIRWHFSRFLNSRS